MATGLCQHPGLLGPLLLAWAEVCPYLHGVGRLYRLDSTDSAPRSASPCRNQCFPHIRSLWPGRRISSPSLYCRTGMNLNLSLQVNPPQLLCQRVVSKVNISHVGWSARFLWGAAPSRGPPAQMDKRDQNQGVPASRAENCTRLEAAKPQGSRICLVLPSNTPQLPFHGPQFPHL